MRRGPAQALRTSSRWGGQQTTFSTVKLLNRKQRTVVGLDIESGSVAATEVRTNGGRQLGGSAIAALAPGISSEGEIADPGALSTTLRELFAEHGLPKQVRVGVANQKVVVRTLRLPAIPDLEELDAAVRFQAADHIPMPLEQAVLDWQIVARGVGEDSRQTDVVVVAARRDMVSSLAGALADAGLKPVGIDVSAFAMIRALAVAPLAGADDRGPAGAAGPTAGAGDAARLYCSLGDLTNLAVARGTGCLFTRTAHFGLESIAQRLAEQRGLHLEQARRLLSEVGLERRLDELEGDGESLAAAREALADGASKVADEIRLSLEFYGAQEDALAVQEIVACGAGTTIAGLCPQLERELGRAVRIAYPATLGHLEPSAAARLTLSYGLALEE